MPIDPNIILRGMANMPDVNALLEQQITGMENINALERQRRADDLVMQDRAAAAAKEQEDAAVKALLPAYSYVLRTGDLAGGLKLAPAEYQDSLVPYMEALQGKSLPEIQAALTGSLVTSDVGRAFLENEARLRTAQIQQGQLDVSREDIVLRRQKQALDARGDGEWKLESGEDENGRPIFVWTNPRTRQIIKADITGGVPAVTPEAAPGLTSIPAPLPSTDLVTPRAPGAPEVAPPISVAQPPAEQPKPQFKPKSKTEKSPDLTDREGKSVNFAIRMADSDAIANELEKEGVVTTDTVSNFFTGVVSALPLSAGANLATQLENAFNAAMPTMSPEEQRLAGAQLDFITAVLRSESGAEIKTSEFPAEYRKYFAVAGDENNPKLLTDKKRRRRNAIEGMKAQAGERGRAEIDRIIKEQSVDASVVTPPAPGATLDGFEYQGVEE